MNSCFVLNNIRSIYNVGSIFRIADGLGWDVILQGYTPHPRLENDERLPYVIQKVEKELKKTAVKAFYSVIWKYKDTPESTLKELNQNNFTIIALEVGVNKSTSVYELDKVSAPLALVLGNEIDGVSKDFLDFSDHLVHIPMRGQNGSLNVGIAGAVAGYHLQNHMY